MVFGFFPEPLDASLRYVRWWVCIFVTLAACAGAGSPLNAPDPEGRGGSSASNSAAGHVWAGPARYEPPRNVEWAYAISSEVIDDLEPDARLARAAERLVTLVHESEAAPTREDRNRVMAESEIAEPVPVLLLVSSPQANRARLTELLRERLPTHCRDVDCNRVGIAQSSNSERHTLVLLAMSNRLELEPIPRRVEPGEEITIRGSARAPTDSVRVLTSTPTEVVRTLHDSAGRDFDVTYVPEETGVYRVEVVGTINRSPTVLALVLVEVGAVGARETYHDHVPAGRTTQPQLVRSRLLDLVNASRRTAGLGMLENNVELERAAQNHARAMLEQGFFAHRDPQGRGPADRVRETGALCSIVLENLAIASSAEEGHATLRDSPIHWRATLDGRTTHAGVGVAGNSDTGLRMVIVMARMLPPFDPTRAAARVVTAIGEARAARSVPALRVDSAISAAAEAAVDRLSVEGGSVEEAQSAARSALAGLGLTAMTAVLLTTADLDEARNVEAVLSRQFDRTGVAVRIARDTTAGYHVVIILAR